MEYQIGLLRLGPDTEEGQSYIIPTQLRRTRVGQTANFELAHLSESSLSTTGNRSSHLYWNFKADLLSKQKELKNDPSSWSMLAVKEGAEPTVTQDTWISPFEAGEHYIADLCANVEQKLMEVLGPDVKLSFYFTAPGYEQTESQTYKNNIKSILRKTLKHEILKRSNFPQLTQGDSFLYEQYGVYYYFTQCERKIDLGVPKANYLIIDIGGSTTDIAVVHLTKTGEVARVFPIYESFQYGGTDYARSIISEVMPNDAPYFSYDEERKSKILRLVEKAKVSILSSDDPQISKSLKTSGETYRFSRDVLDKAFDKDWNWKIKKNILKVLAIAENDQRINYTGDKFAIDGILLAGGTSKLQRFRDNLSNDPELQRYFSKNHTVSYATKADPSSLASLGLGISILERTLRDKEGTKNDLPMAETVCLNIRDDKNNVLNIRRLTSRNGTPKNLLFTVEQVLKSAPENNNGRVHFPRDLFSSAEIDQLPEQLRLEFTTDCNPRPQTLSLNLSEPTGLGRNIPEGLYFSTAVDKPNVRSSDLSPSKLRVDPYFYRFLPLSKDYRRCDNKGRPSKIDISLAPVNINLEKDRAYVCIDFGMNNTSVAVFAPSYSLSEEHFQVLKVVPSTGLAEEPHELNIVIENRTYQVIKEVAYNPSTKLPIHLVEREKEYFLATENDNEKSRYKIIPISDPLSPDKINPQQAIALVTLPRFLGVHPHTGAAVGINYNVDGPVLIHGDLDTILLPDLETDFGSQVEDVIPWIHLDTILLPSLETALEMTLEDALEQLPPYPSASILPRFLGVHPQTGAPVEIIERPNGPTLAHGSFDRDYVRLPDWNQVCEITLEEALELLPLYEPIDSPEDLDVSVSPKTETTLHLSEDLKESLESLTNALKSQANQNSEILEALLQVAKQAPKKNLQKAEAEESQQIQPAQQQEIHVELRPYETGTEISFRGFEEFVSDQGFSYEPSVLRQVWTHTQNKHSRLAILAGPPGSGKTQLVSLLAEYFNRDLTYKSYREEFHLLEPVLPSWFSSENLLGFYSQITEQFHPTNFFKFLKRAEHHHIADINRLFFVCLDEFNLAQPEQYLAKVLSVMESESAEMTVCQETGQSVLIPSNLKLFATINTDSASKALSPKVLDRSVLIRITPSKERVVDFSKNKSSPVPFANQVLAQFHAYLDVLYDLGSASGAAFGFRTIDTAIAHLEAHPYVELEGSNTTESVIEEVIDEIISSIFLSKLPGYNRFEGEESYRKTLVKTMEKFQQGHLKQSTKIIEKIKAGYPGQSAF